MSFPDHLHRLFKDEKKARKSGKPLHVHRYHKKVAKEVGLLRGQWKKGWEFNWYNNHGLTSVKVLRIKPYTPWVKIQLPDGTVKSVRYTTLFTRNPE